MIEFYQEQAGRFCIWLTNLDVGIHLLPYKDFRCWGVKELTPTLKVFGVGPIALIVLPE
jgi:hypothetical protein